MCHQRTKRNGDCAVTGQRWGAQEAEQLEQTVQDLLTYGILHLSVPPLPQLAWPEPVMCRPNAGRVGQGRVRCGQWQRGAAMDPFDVRRGLVTPVCLAHGSGDSVGLRELLSELASLK
ncbi:hypothetical protein MHYP_G00196590 [Metynnis hypsauchen]